LLVCAALALTACATQYSDIAAVRQQPPGTQVALRGVVTVPFGAIGEYIAAQDATGGIAIVRPGWNPEFPGTVAVGSRIEVAGRLLLLRDGQLAVEPTWYRHRGSTVPSIRPLRTGEVGPANEGTLVAVAGRLVRPPLDDAPWGWKLFVDDGSGELLVFVAPGTGISTAPLRAGMHLHVTGYSGRYDRHAELLPRSPADVAVTELP
jgi:hypothetical protein